MTRQRRAKERVIPPSQLAWVCKPDDEWNSITPTKEDIARAHFENRQLKRDFIPSVVSLDYRYIPEWPSCLEDVEEEYKLPNIDPCLPFQGRACGDATLLESGTARGIDHAQFDALFYDLTMKAKHIFTPAWLKTAVMYPLGPEQIRKIKKGNYFKDIRYRLLVNNNNSTAILAVENIKNEEFTISIIEQFLGEPTQKTGNIVIAAPNSGYAMYMRYGELPFHVLEANETPIALVFDEHYNRNGALSPEVWYGRNIGCYVRSSRVLSDPEKSWLNTRCNRNDLRHRRIRLLEFNSPIERNVAVSNGRFEYLNVLFCDAMFSCTQPTDQIHLYITYEIEPKYLECVAVTVAHENDKQFVESSFNSHGLTVNYYNDNCRKEPSLKYEPSVKTMVLHNFPRHLRTFESRKWLIKRIASRNFFDLESIEPFTERDSDSNRYCSSVKNQEIKLLIEWQLYKSGYFNNIYRPIDAPWTDHMQGGLGARNLLRVVKERPDVPWVVRRKNVGPNQPKEKFTVHFQNIEFGIRYIEPLLREYHKWPLCRNNSGDCYGPSFTPCFRRSFTISRVVRIAIRTPLYALDSRLRKTFSRLSKNEDVMMKNEESTYFGVRLHEEWRDGNDFGIIGVQGWSPQGIRHFGGRLLKLLTPKTFDTTNHPELTFGIGEEYVRSLNQKYEGEVVVDIDKYRQTINLIGGRVTEAVNDLKTYSKNKGSIIMSVRIPLHFPFIDGRILEVLENVSIEQLAFILGVNRLEYNHQDKVILFEGSIEAHEKLMKGLEEISQEIYKREVRNREAPAIANQTCPTCMTEIGQSDFYRFHCGHNVCRLCVNVMIKNQIEAAELKFTCLEDGCEEFISPNEIMDIVLGDSRRIRDFDTMKLEELVMKMKDAVINNSHLSLKPCPTPDCLGIISKSNEATEEAKECNNCGHKYCRKCLLDIHSGRTCEEHARLQIPDASIQKYKEDSGSKNCPNCNHLVNKTDGCNHVQCQCKTHFCWVCLFQASESGPIYAHMQEEHGGHGGNYEIPEFEDGNIDVQRAIAENLRLQDRFPDDDWDTDETDDDFDQEEEDRLNREFLNQRGINPHLPLAEIRRINREQEAAAAMMRNLNLAEQQQVVPVPEVFEPAPTQAPEILEEQRALQVPQVFMAHQETLGNDQIHQWPRAGFATAPQTAPVYQFTTEAERLEAERETRRALNIPEIPTGAARPARYLDEFPALLLEIWPEYYESADRRAVLLTWINESTNQDELDHRVSELFRYAQDGVDPDA
ncbi:hypothetical protein GCK72_006668 [Caenorhabditis remanei]|uniref:RING-type domain-containing protein n=1 Tax=Caenorhabditis remanei TaxID=31234 RepID=A0A6A5HFK0_CAERE|nr:hypothetical protein GCK72_006668 [Caenorhabditis remanei]KAF1766710.1 hypothetical protein GCK72_006668 [Caenorhabditis remanei]